jgi:uncharacterized membrane protein YbhN (UPF0104 family)
MAEPSLPTPPAPSPEDSPRTVLERLGDAGEVALSLGGEHSRWRRVLTIVLIVLTVGFLVLFVGSQWSRLPEIEWRFRPAWLAVCVAALVVFQALQNQLWVWTLRGLGSSLPAAKAWAIWSMTLLARYVPTNLAMVVGRVAMAEREGVSKRVCMASIVYQLGVSFAGATAVAAYFVIVLPKLQAQPARFAVLAMPVLAVIALDPRVFHRLANYALRRLGREPLPLSLPRSDVLALTAVAALSFGIAGVSVWAFAEAIHGVGAGDVPAAIGSYSVAFAASVLTVVLPGGLGAREGVMVLALSPVLPAVVGLAVAVAVRLLQVSVEIVYAMLTPVWARRYERASAAP